jgi:hypothetical protein
MTKIDLQAEIETLQTAIDDFEARLGAKIDAQTLRLTVRLGSILIAGLIATGFLIFASVLLLIPDSSCPGLSRASSSFTDLAVKTWMAGTSPAMTQERGHARHQIDPR